MTVSDVLLDPYDYDFHEDPYPYYKRLRDEAPLYHNEDLGFWALSRHRDVLAGFRNSTTLSNREGVSLDPISRGPHASKTMSFLAMDDPAATLAIEFAKFACAWIHMRKFGPR